MEWRATDKLSFKAEYSSDDYSGVYGERSGIEHKSPFNFGVGYQVSQSAHLAAYYTYGSELALQFSYAFNPKTPPAPSGYDNAPTPVLVRPPRSTNPQAWSNGWASKSESRSVLEKNMKTALEREGLVLEKFQYNLTTIRLHYKNTPIGASRKLLDAPHAPLPVDSRIRSKHSSLSPW